MKTNNLVQTKSHAFAVRMVRFYRHLSGMKKEFVLSRQVLRAGTSIGANVEEAIGGQTKADFISKMGIAYKEAHETSYCLRLLKDTDYLAETEFQSIHADAEKSFVESSLPFKKQPKPTKMPIRNSSLVIHHSTHILLLYTEEKRDTIYYGGRA